MEFACQWLTEDGKYDPQQVRTQLQAMLGSAKLDEKVYDFLHVQSNVDRITKACKDFGMVYDSSTGSFYYVKKGSLPVSEGKAVRVKDLRPSREG